MKLWSYFYIGCVSSPLNFIATYWILRFQAIFECRLLPCLIAISRNINERENEWMAPPRHSDRLQTLMLFSLGPATPFHQFSQKLGLYVLCKPVTVKQMKRAKNMTSFDRGNNADTGQDILQKQTQESQDFTQNSEKRQQFCGFFLVRDQRRIARLVQTDLKAVVTHRITLFSHGERKSISKCAPPPNVRLMGYKSRKPCRASILSGYSGHISTTT